jgi:hypothetical protein
MATLITLPPPRPPVEEDSKTPKQPQDRSAEPSDKDPQLRGAPVQSHRDIGDEQGIRDFGAEGNPNCWDLD